MNLIVCVVLPFTAACDDGVECGAGTIQRGDRCEVPQLADTGGADTTDVASSCGPYYCTTLGDDVCPCRLRGFDPVTVVEYFASGGTTVAFVDAPVSPTVCGVPEGQSPIGSAAAVRVHFSYWPRDASDCDALEGGVDAFYEEWADGEDVFWSEALSAAVLTRHVPERGTCAFDFEASFGAGLAWTHQFELVIDATPTSSCYAAP